MRRSIKVLIIDDSALVRRTLADIIHSDPELEVAGTAADPYFAAKKIRQALPDVITLDIEMPRMDGITFLKTLMAQFPVPVVIISSITQSGGELALRALELGAVEIITKAEIKNTKEHLQETCIRITDAIKAAYSAPIKRTPLNKPVLKTIRSATKLVSYKMTDKVIAIGASTGGTEALRLFLKKMPVDCPGVVIVQHMPAGFTNSFAAHLNAICEITVKEAADGDRVMRGHAYICPGGRHMKLIRSGVHFNIRITDGELVNRHRPSVDVLFQSVAENATRNAIGIIMTGMGRDGAAGLLQMKQAGATTIAQDEVSCVVFGMPKEAIKLQAADYILPLDEIPARALSVFTNFR
jgi:two-component system, chemotaxis family, protein-glutamate methylesterase/glutaminase